MNLAKKGTVLLAALSVFAMTSCGSKGQTIDLDKAKEWLEDVNMDNIEKTYLKTQNFKWDAKVEGEGMLPTEDKLGFAEVVLAYYVDDNKVETSTPDVEFIKKFAKLNDSLDYIKEKWKEKPVSSINTFYYFSADRLQGAVDQEATSDETFTLLDNKLHFKLVYKQELPGSEKEISLNMDYVVGKDGLVSNIDIDVAKQNVKGTIPNFIDYEGTFSGSIKQTITYEQK